MQQNLEKKKNPDRKKSVCYSVCFYGNHPQLCLLQFAHLHPYQPIKSHHIFTVLVLFFMSVNCNHKVIFILLYFLLNS